MPTVTLEDVRTHLSEILADLQAGDEVAILQAGEEIARLTRSGPQQWPCQAGCYRKAEFSMAADFDAPLDEFKEYMLSVVVDILSEIPRSPAATRGHHVSDVIGIDRLKGNRRVEMIPPI